MVYAESRRQFLKDTALLAANVALGPQRTDTEKQEIPSKGWHWAQCDAYPFENPDNPLLQYQPGIYQGEFTIAGYYQDGDKIVAIIVPHDSTGNEIHTPAIEELEAIQMAVSQTNADFIRAGWPDLETHTLAHTDGQELQVVPIIHFMEEDDPKSDEELGSSFATSGCNRAPVISIVPSLDNKNQLSGYTYQQWLGVIAAHETVHAHTNSLMAKRESPTSEHIDREGLATWYGLASQWSGKREDLPAPYVNFLQAKSDFKVIDIKMYYDKDYKQLEPNKDTNYGAYIFWGAVHSLLKRQGMPDNSEVLSIYRNFISEVKQKSETLDLDPEEVRQILVDVLQKQTNLSENQIMAEVLRTQLDPSSELYPLSRTVLGAYPRTEIEINPGEEVEVPLEQGLVTQIFETTLNGESLSITTPFPEPNKGLLAFVTLVVPENGEAEIYIPVEETDQYGKTVQVTKIRHCPHNCNVYVLSGHLLAQDEEMLWSKE